MKVTSKPCEYCGEGLLVKSTNGSHVAEDKYFAFQGHTCRRKRIVTVRLLRCYDGGRYTYLRVHPSEYAYKG
jgi:hypothetical protein